MRIIFQFLGFLILGIVTTTSVLAMESAGFLPADADMDNSVPSPESVFGWQVGDWRIQHPMLVQYMHQLAAESDRVSVKLTGYTYEQRPLLQVIISSAENQAKLETLRQAHLNGTGTGDLDAPLVVWLGYSVHGNEASGSNAAPIVAWYLAASRSEYVKELLENTIIIIDPSLNPDGLERFSSWSNSNASKNSVADRNGRIHNEDWPGGRTNHYLFDLNRDWLPLVHPESRARIAEYHRWLPHVLTDHHETGHDGFFFQPGVPSRQHPLTPPETLDMTLALAKFHAQSFDSAGVMFFTEDTYDDFYYGKGSTYPDINGSIGILFEQPSVRGRITDRTNGPLLFTEAIHNQIRTSLSTLKGAHALSDEFKKYQTGFFQTMQRRANDAGFQGWVIGDNGDTARALDMLEIFRQQDVEFQALAEEVTVDGQVYRPQHAWFIPARQRQFGLAKAMLEKRTKFEDDTFYDVSAWSLPLAYDLPYARVKRIPSTSTDVGARDALAPVAGAVAWVISWQQLNAPAILQDLQDAGARVRAATKPFTMGADKKFSAGSLVVLAGIQDEEAAAAVFTVLQQAAEQGVNVDSFESHLSTDGPGLGTSHFKAVPQFKPLLIVGEGTRGYDAGEAWFELDQRLGVAAVMVNMNQLQKVRLADYSHLLMVDGSYKDMGNAQQKNIASWVEQGGILIASQRAASWAESLCYSGNGCIGAAADVGKEGSRVPGEPEPVAYDNFEQKRAELTIGGAIVGTRVDVTHPLAYGLQPELPLFRKGTTLLQASDNAFTTPVRYMEKPLLSGYIGEARLAEISNQPAVIAQRQGKGAVIRFANNPLFRGFWRGTGRLWVNALYFGPLLKATQLPD